MSDSKNPPAFPTDSEHQCGPAGWHHEGMTLRDYFAAKALAAMIAKDGKGGALCGAKGVPSLARFAYEYADAMLEARASHA